MYKITKGYKVGRGVAFYDLVDTLKEKERTKVEKDEVVKMCDNGEIENAKIQWWEGKPIVRCSDKHLEIVKISSTGNIVASTTVVVRKKEEKMPESKVVGQLNKKKAAKRNIEFNSYKDQKAVNIYKRIDLTEVVTISDLFDKVATDFGARYKDEYKKKFGAKIKLERKVSEIAREQLLNIQAAMATYIMNMMYDEIAEVYTKYN